MFRVIANCIRFRSRENVERVLTSCCFVLFFAQCCYSPTVDPPSGAFYSSWSWEDVQSRAPNMVPCTVRLLIATLSFITLCLMSLNPKS